MLVLPETKLQTDWLKQQQNSLNPISPPHKKKSRPFWNRSRNQPEDWKTMDMTHRKTRLTPLTGGPKPPSSTCALARKTSEEIIDLADSAHCKCSSEEQTPEHILQTCPHLETLGQQFWPEDTEMGTKLLGLAAELQWTVDFLAATSLRI